MRITRRQLRQIIQEELGRLHEQDDKQASHLIFISGMDLFGTYRIDVRVSSVETGAIEDGSEGGFEGTDKNKVVADAQAHIDKLKQDYPGAKVKPADDLDQASLDLIKDFMGLN